MQLQDPTPLVILLEHFCVEEKRRDRTSDNACCCFLHTVHADRMGLTEDGSGQTDLLSMGSQT